MKSATCRIVIVLCAAVVAADAPAAHAAVLCAKAKRGEPTGVLRLRAACKARETRVDPAALGLLVAGPPGAPGAPGGRPARRGGREPPGPTGSFASTATARRAPAR